MTAYSSALATDFNDRNMSQRCFQHSPRPHSYQSHYPASALLILLPATSAGRAVPAPAGFSSKSSMVARRGAQGSHPRPGSPNHPSFPFLALGSDPQPAAGTAPARKPPAPATRWDRGCPRASLRLPSRLRHLQPWSSPWPVMPSGKPGKLHPQTHGSPVRVITRNGWATAAPHLTQPALGSGTSPEMATTGMLPPSPGCRGQGGLSAGAGDAPAPTKKKKKKSQINLSATSAAPNARLHAGGQTLCSPLRDGC